MTGLLISVRDAVEAATALAGGVDLLDVKEPALGSLGAASPAIWRDVLDICRGCVPTSVALGELRELDDRLDIEGLGHFDYAKVGLADCGRRSDWHRRWTELLDLLPPLVIPVAVVYADWRHCGAPPPQDIIRRAADTRCGVVLFDTYAKSSGDLFTHLPPEDLRPMIAGIHGCGLLVVLGGSLAGSSLTIACELSPDYVAVRAAACRETRTGPVDLDRVRHLSSLIRAAAYSTDERRPPFVVASRCAGRTAARGKPPFA